MTGKGKLSCAMYTAALVLPLNVMSAATNQVYINTNTPSQLAASSAITVSELKQGKRITRHQSSGKTQKQRYLIELHGDGLLNFKSRYRHQSGVSHSEQVQQYASAMRAHSEEIERNQTKAMQQIRSLAKNSEVIYRFKNTTNMLVVDVHPDAVSRIKQLSGVKTVTEEQIFSTTLEQSVPLINAPLVWDMNTEQGLSLKGNGISVAILDTGIDYTHPDLGGCIGVSCRVTHGYDFIDNDNDPMDGNGHGTHVAGIVGANGTLKGVAPDVTFHAYKVLSDQGFGGNGGIIAALEKAVDPDGDPLTDDGVDIINMSLGGSGSADGPLSQAANAAVQAGVVVVVAAGNDGQYGDINQSEPASAVDVITVASSTKSDTLSSFSSKGLPDTTTKPEITAPGSAINSTMPGGGYASLDGTSMAAPHIAGAAALLLQNQPSLSPSEVKSQIMAGGVDLGLDPFSQGAGRIDVAKSIGADVVSPQGFVHFGEIDKSAVSFTQTGTITLSNTSNTEKVFTSRFRGSMPTGAALSVSQREITIPANSSVDVVLTMQVDNVASLNVADNGAGVLYDAFELVSDSQTQLAIPLSVSHSLQGTFTTNAPGTVLVQVSANDGSFSASTEVTAGVSKRISMTNKPSSMFVFYLGLDESNVPVELPQNATLIGLETFDVNASSDFSQFLNIGDLNRSVGINGITSKSGESLARETITADFVDYGVTLNEQSLFTSLDGFYFDKLMPYLVVGNLAPTTSLELMTINTVQSELVSDDSEQRFVTIDHLVSDELALGNHDVDFRTTRRSEVTLNQHIDSDYYIYAVNAFDYTLGLGKAADAEKIITHYLPERDSQPKPLVQITQMKQVDDQDVMTASTPFFAPSSNNQLDLFQDLYTTNDAVVTTPNYQLDLSSEGLFWSGAISFDNGTVRLSDYDFSLYGHNLISDTTENEHNYGLNTSLVTECRQQDGSTSILEETMIASMTSTEQSLSLTNATCDGVTQLRFSYDNRLAGELYRSELLLDVSDSDLIAPVDSIHLFEGEKLVVDQTINKVNPRIELHSEWGLSFTSLMMRVAQDEWVSLPNTHQDDSAYVASLPMMPGDQVVDIRVTYQSLGGLPVTQTLNGFMNLGLTAGSDNDVDDDGIDNSIDNDHDNDGVSNDDDAFVFDSTESVDTDADGIGNNGDLDDDNDNVPDIDDAFPLDASETVDTDADGIGNNADSDDDNDNVPDVDDAFPLDASESIDTDSDGTGNNADNDDDNDGVDDSNDAFPLDATRSAQEQNNAENESSASGGSTSWLMLMLLMLVTRLRRS